MRDKVVVTWSGGKDSALALRSVAAECEVTALLTTITSDYDRVSMHGVRTSLLERQAEALGFPLEEVYIGKSSSNSDYEAGMAAILRKYRELGVRSVVFGDLFVEDIRRYREGNLAKLDMFAIFPLWGLNTTELARNFIDSGFKAVVTCVDGKALDGRFAGTSFDRRFLSELPPGVDPCGENGEFHTFVYDGPLFREMVRFQKGEVVLREERYYFCDLVPADGTRPVS